MCLVLFSLVAAAFLANKDVYIWYSEEGPGRAAALPSPRLAVPNVTVHPSTASVPIAVLLYDGPLLCGFNVAIKGLTTVNQYFLLVHISENGCQKD